MITFKADGTDYKLEVTANTIKQMEQRGIDFSKLGNKITSGEILWKGMFIAHHNSVPDAKRMEIYRALSSVEDGSEPEYDEDGEPVDALMTAVGAEYENAIRNMKRQQGNLAWKRS